MSLQFSRQLAVLMMAIFGETAASNHTCKPFGRPDFHPLGLNEEYLRPYLGQLTDYRENPIARRYLLFAEIVDVLPSWLEDWFVPLVLPNSAITIPVNKTIDVLGKNITIETLTINHLNTFTQLKPLEFLPTGRFTFRSQIRLKETTIFAKTNLGLTIPIPLEAVGIDVTFILAFDRYRMCKVWGATMRSSTPCAVGPIFHDPKTNATGLKIDDLHLTLYAVPLPLMGLVANMANTAIQKYIPQIQKNSPCPTSTAPRLNGGLDYVLNASKVCIVNNGGFAVSWSYTNCANCAKSISTRNVPADQMVCMNTFPFIAGEEGDIMRIQVKAEGGILEIIDPAVRYAPQSLMVASMECSGSADLYSCDLVSYASMNPLAAPEVSKVCVINQAGFVLDFKAINMRTFMPVVSGSYPGNKKQCVDLGHDLFAKEGDWFSIEVHAHAGKTKRANRLVKYVKNGFPVGFQCKGSTMSYSCDVVTGPLDEMTEADSGGSALIVV